MDYKEKINEWLDSKIITEDYKDEIRKINDQEELKDRFYKYLEFGTAGLRGKIGAGTNRMNIYLVAKVSQAISNILNKKEEKNKSVAISRDNRLFSDEFTKVTASVFAANGIKVYLYKDIKPTPMLSYAVRYLSANAGVMITASHNPKDYNGYKLYWDKGSQILEDVADQVSKENTKLKFDDIKIMDFEKAIDENLIEYISKDLEYSYYKETLSMAINDKDLDKDIKIVYTPLHGTGNIPVRNILSKRGFNNIILVEDQAIADPYFTTIDYPNPEFIEAFKYGLEYGKKYDGDLILATDPDCDRVSFMAKDKNGEYKSFNGNQIGAMMIYYILSQLKEKSKLNPKDAIVKSVVTGNLGKIIADDFSVKCFESLTGFKNICNYANIWDEDKDNKFLFGYEESIGYVFGDYVRDKDAVVSSMIICEMAAYYKKKSMTLVDLLDEIYEKYGYYKENLLNFKFEGIAGKKHIEKIISYFRNEDIGKDLGLDVKEKIDYKEGYKGLPATNLLIFHLNNDSWFAVRPSGTEPKIKFYIYANDKLEEKSQEKLDKITDKIKKKIEELA
ncbi:phospho-sugar mutase [Peptoniphilus obesi]|uniref:phospho-sugar mutase n=1 Tax=Peptoniphilus obesi TaxID=1472765 RepID=UPI0004AD9BDB|nr:phospho-sugar mutase [Peptoniphilus obesi]